MSLLTAAAGPGAYETPSVDLIRGHRAGRRGFGFGSAARTKAGSVLLLPSQAEKTLAGEHVRGGNVEVTEGMLHLHGAQVWGWATATLRQETLCKETAAIWAATMVEARKASQPVRLAWLGMDRLGTFF